MKKIVRQPDLSMHLNNKCSFILRLWQVEQSDTPDWQASVEILKTGKRIGFSSLEQLFAFLIDFTEANCDVQPVGNMGKDTDNC
jgi:hypothetical protein